MADAANCTVFELSTDGVPAARRFELWRDTALRRLDVEKVSPASAFEGRLRRLVSKTAEFWDHRTDPIWVQRSRTRCRMDGRGDIGVALVLGCTNATIENVHELTLNAGDLYVMDYAEPVRAMRPRHRELALLLPRQTVTDLLGDDLSPLAGQRLPLAGIGRLLSSHMARMGDEADALSTGNRALAIDAAAAMALATLQAFVRTRPDPDQVAEGLFVAAGAAIERMCGDAGLSPDVIAATVGCSRASLYRLFAAHGQTVAAAIWSARLKRARRMLTEPSHRDLSVGAIAYRCGFSDQSTFSRMFKRRYGLSPRDARAFAQGQRE